MHVALCKYEARNLAYGRNATSRRKARPPEVRFGSNSDSRRGYLPRPELGVKRTKSAGKRTMRLADRPRQIPAQITGGACGAWRPAKRSRGPAGARLLSRKCSGPSGAEIATWPPPRSRAPRSTESGCLQARQGAPVSLSVPRVGSGGRSFALAHDGASPPPRRALVRAGRAWLAAAPW